MDQNSSSSSTAIPAPVSDTTSSVSIGTDTSAMPASDSATIVSPDFNSIEAAPAPQNTGVSSEVARKIIEAQNVLVALSSDPSVDEMAAAIGLSLFLDKLGKRATAIYSGSTPNALEFLKPEETFETTADTLQDFVIALNKDKADHLRYKLDGDYVKIFITPYKTRVSEEDLDFSYGDFNVDLVLALDVANGIDLDAALREHGRIMHDAVVVNITTGNPGKFGEIEWSDKAASSVSEMIAKLLYSLGSKSKIEKDEATAFLTGIVAATNRFSNAKTTPETMQISSQLMKSGANQQLISKNITPDVENEIYSILDDDTPKQNTDSTELNIAHGGEDDTSTTEASTAEPRDSVSTDEGSSLLNDLKAAEASLAQTGSETVPDTSNQPVKIETSSALSLDAIQSAEPTLPPVNPEPSSATLPASSLATPEPSKIAEPAPLDSVSSTSAPTIATPNPTTDTEEGINSQPEKVIQPPAGMDFGTPDDSEKYGKMLEDAISGLSDGTANVAAPVASDNSITSASSSSLSSASEPTNINPTSGNATTFNNPASMMTPSVPSTPEINGVPEINYMPMPGEEILPPPPTPPIDMSSSAPAAPADLASPVAPIAPAEPVVPTQPSTQPINPTLPSLGSQPAMQDQVYNPQASDPGAFKIPGM